MNRCEGSSVYIDLYVAVDMKR